MRSIGQLSRTTGCNVETIRYYERIGLMPEPARSEGNQRRYTQAHEERLAFIRHARELGFTLDAIRELLSLSDRPDASCEEVDRIATEQLEHVRGRIARLQALEQELQRMVTYCQGGEVAHCRILQVLSDHRLCATEHSAP